MGRVFRRVVVAVAIGGMAVLALPNANVSAAKPEPSPAGAASVRTYGSWLTVSSNGERALNDTTKHADVGLYASTKKVSRPFYRFSTSALAGKHILSATFQHKLIHSPNEDCEATTFGPAVEVGRTENFTSTTAWPGPKWLQTLYSNSTVHGQQGKCPGAKTPEWDVEAGVEAVAAARQPVIVLGLRSANEKDGNGWRVFDNDTELPAPYPNLIVEYNTPPNVPTELKLPAGAPCGTDLFPTPISTSTPRLQALVTDPDDAGMGVSGLVPRFELTAATGGPALWSYAATTTYSGGRPMVNVPEGTIRNGSTYRWRVRTEEPTEEGTDLSAWSPWCSFSVDTVAPTMPSVHSSDYPDTSSGGPTGSGGVGVPGRFTFSNGLRSDVTQYTYAFNGGPHRTARPSAPGRPVTVSFTPERIGVNTLVVYASDRAGNGSLSRYYSFEVASN
ncbi:hypothetical protein [Tenggerimyces flavus]|uniref:Uncharacterized protein n=1 Tax=Tenggerimyces flavus TaxID=1708749 RepID=A0ABV7YJM3_9ACTN|nr:hypothetical protein [Tenggerimyces flavus]MBM7784068.1 hypothetical protein [Tenggerimyces flavus]